MKITVRLYRSTDLDLIGLACADGVSVSKELKKCLVSFVRGVPYSIQLNPIDVSSVIMTKKSVTLQFYLESKSCGDVIDWLKTIRPRQRNSFLKNLLRSSLPCPYLYMYQTSPRMVSHMIADIYDRQIAVNNEIPTEDMVTNKTSSVAKNDKANNVTKKQNEIVVSKKTETQSSKPVCDNAIPVSHNISESIVTENTNNAQTSLNDSFSDCSMSQPDFSCENNQDTNFNQDEEDALFNALMNI